MTPFPEQLRPDLREQFLLRDDVAFLNHGSFGACPQPVFAAYQAWQLELEREPVDFIGRRFAGLMQTARERLAAYLGADADEIVCVPAGVRQLKQRSVKRSLNLRSVCSARRTCSASGIPQTTIGMRVLTISTLSHWAALVITLARSMSNR